MKMFAMTFATGLVVVLGLMVGIPAQAQVYGGVGGFNSVQGASFNSFRGGGFNNVRGRQVVVQRQVVVAQPVVVAPRVRQRSLSIQSQRVGGLFGGARSFSFQSQRVGGFF